MCLSVDLPDPDGPVIATNSPGSTSSDTPRSARPSTSPTMYVLSRLLTEMTGARAETAAYSKRKASIGSSRAALRAG